MRFIIAFFALCVSASAFAQEEQTGPVDDFAAKMSGHRSLVCEIASSCDEGFVTKDDLDGAFSETDTRLDDLEKITSRASPIRKDFNALRAEYDLFVIEMRGRLVDETAPDGSVPPDWFSSFKVEYEGGKQSFADQLAAIQVDIADLKARVTALEASDKRQDRKLVDHERRIGELEERAVGVYVGGTAGLTTGFQPEIPDDKGQVLTAPQLVTGFAGVSVRYAAPSGIYATLSGVLFGGFVPSGTAPIEGARGHAILGYGFDNGLEGLELGGLVGFTAYGARHMGTDKPCCYGARFQGVDIGVSGGYRITPSIILGADLFVTPGFAGNYEGEWMALSETAGLHIDFVAPVGKR